MTVYLGTSAALKLLIDEPESGALALWLEECPDELVSSFLLHTELHCAAQRRGELDVAAVQAVLQSVELVDVGRDDLLRAASSAWRLRSADAIHLATALRLGCAAVVTYGEELATVARASGIAVHAPCGAATHPGAHLEQRGE